MHIEPNSADMFLSSRQETSATIQEPPALRRQKSARQNSCNQHLQICNKTNNFIHPQNEHLHKNHREAHLRHQYLLSFTTESHRYAELRFGSTLLPALSECSIRPVHETLGVAILFQAERCRSGRK
jgi:hypothetical protein